MCEPVGGRHHHGTGSFGDGFGGGANFGRVAEIEPAAVDEDEQGGER